MIDISSSLMFRVHWYCKVSSWTHTLNKLSLVLMRRINLTRLLDRRGHSLSQHTQFLKMRMIFYETLLHSIGPTRSHLARFASARFALHTHKNFWEKKSVSQSTQNALKRIEMQKKIFYPFDRLRASRVAQSPSGVAQWNFNTINRT